MSTLRTIGFRQLSRTRPESGPVMGARTIMMAKVEERWQEQQSPTTSMGNVLLCLLPHCVAFGDVANKSVMRSRLLKVRPRQVYDRTVCFLRKLAFFLL